MFVSLGMRNLLIIIYILLTLNSRAQQTNYALMEINKESVVRGDFKIEIASDKVFIGNDTYHIHSQKENNFLLMKEGVVYEMTLLEDSLSLLSLNQNVLLVYYKD